MADIQPYINAALFIGCGCIGWFARTLWDGQQKIKDDMALFKVKVAEEYVPNNRFETVLQQINRNIQRVLDKLDEKADK
jgi:hypothetical protein